MGLDLYLSTPISCPHCGKPIAGDDERWWRNITHNVSPMWKLAGVYDALYESEGLIAKEVLSTLQEGVARMVLNPEEYKKLNPTNGWGCYESALEFLIDFQSAIVNNPDTMIHVSR